MIAEQLPLLVAEETSISDKDSFTHYLKEFNEFAKKTHVENYNDTKIKIFTNEFWTSKQRAASSLHEISYRACFKPQLPRFFISKLTKKGDRVYDPFMGRGTTLLESTFMNREPIGCDINPLSDILFRPRVNPPTLNEVSTRVTEILSNKITSNEEEQLLTFYHRDTLDEILTLKKYFLNKERHSSLDRTDKWIRMVATNRLTGHSSGFFSVYTLPPNQAVSIESQIKINIKRKQTPEYKNVKSIIEKKSKTLLNKVLDKDLNTLKTVKKEPLILTGSCDKTPQIPSNSVSLVVTSPPFLDVVNYKKDNWLRCWFNGINSDEIEIWQLKKAEDWMNKMENVFKELHRILKVGGHIAFEVGEIKGGKVFMEDLVIPSASKAGLKTELIIVNDQVFTKTANCWGISNTNKGTNTNRIVLLKKD